MFDTGVTSAIAKRLSANIDPKLRGKLFEQWIILESDRLIHYHQAEINMSYWRTSNGAEVDLLLEQHGKLIAAIEIKSIPKISNSHLSGLCSFQEDNPKVPCYVLCTTQNSYKIGSVNIIPWKKYFSILKSFMK